MVEQLRRAHQQNFRSIVKRLRFHADLVEKTLKKERIALTREIIGELVNIANTIGHFPRKAREALERMRLNPKLRDFFDKPELKDEFGDFGSC